MPWKYVHRGSHRWAVHPTLFPCLPKGKYQVIKKLLPVVSWIGFFASAVSEYGLDIDFPLTPAFWLAIVCCMMFAPVGHAALTSRIHGGRKRETATYFSGGLPSLSDSANLINTGPKSPRTNERSSSFIQGAFSLTGSYRCQMTSGGVTGAVRSAIPVAIFLSPTVTRGPPLSNSQIEDPPDRLARQFFTPRFPPRLTVHNSPTAHDAFLSGADQTQVYSAIGGDQA